MSKKSKKDKRVAEDVCVNIGLLKEESTGEIKPVRCSVIPLRASASCNVNELKKLAFNKLSRYCPEFTCERVSDCRLCFKTGETVRYIPGTMVPFTLKAYKDDLATRYSRITLYLIPYEDDEDDLGHPVESHSGLYSSRYTHM